MNFKQNQKKIVEREKIDHYGDAKIDEANGIIE
jgi:hypothetical protein